MLRYNCHVIHTVVLFWLNIKHGFEGDFFLVYFYQGLITKELWQTSGTPQKQRGSEVPLWLLRTDELVYGTKTMLTSI